MLFVIEITLRDEFREWRWRSGFSATGICISDMIRPEKTFRKNENTLGVIEINGNRSVMNRILPPRNT